jgi:hypothetical protein
MVLLRTECPVGPDTMLTLLLACGGPVPRGETPIRSGQQAAASVGPHRGKRAPLGGMMVSSCLRIRTEDHHEGSQEERSQGPEVSGQVLIYSWVGFPGCTRRTTDRQEAEASSDPAAVSA